MLRSSGSSPKTPTSPRVQQPYQDDSSSPQGTAPMALIKAADMEEVHGPNHRHPKKFSVLAKVKERAKKWRHSLSRKRQPVDSNATPSWGVSLEDDGGDDDHNVEEDAEFFGTPMHQFEQPTEEVKETTTSRLAQGSTPEASQKDGLPNNDSPGNEPDKPITPSPEKATDSTESIVSKFDKLAIGVPEGPITGWEDASEGGAEEQEWASPRAMNWDKGVSVKEYLMHKLKPGEEDRALSQVISDAISPRRKSNEASVVEKVKDTVTSLLRKEEPPSAAPTMHTASNSLTQFPISTNPHEAMEEESHGRVLQSN